MDQPHLFCFGLGYSARVLARRLLAEGWSVSGTCRNQGKVDELSAQGINAWRFGDDRRLDQPERSLRGVTHLLSSVPPSAENDPVLAVHAEDLINIGDQLRWIGYLSTVGVYGDHQGAWIDESCPPNPQSTSSKRRLKAENAWLDLGERIQAPTHLFRLPGIYGPGGRSQISALRSGKARRIIKPGQVFNRIHVEDLARVVMASMQQPQGSPIYNVTDDEPAATDQVVAYAARLLGIEPPPEEDFEDAQLSPFARHFYAECKRIRNDLIKRELGVRLRYPDYRRGLDAIAAQESEK